MEEELKQLTVGELKAQLSGMPDHLEVFIRAKSNPCGNIWEAGKADKSTYGFFTESIPCVIIEPAFK